MLKLDEHKFYIEGGEVFYTENPDFLYRVLKGSILVYLVPFTDKKSARRMFLAEFGEGSLIPGFCHENGGKNWKFALLALDEADFEEVPDTDSLSREQVRNTFCQSLGIGGLSGAEYEKGIIELYNLNTVKEEGYIYKNQKESETAKEHLLGMIFDSLSRSSEKNNFETQPTGNGLYDCAAFLCSMEKIKIASREKVIKSVGKNFTLEDIARVSHFTIRQITLPDKWYKKDCGMFMSFRKETGEPLCFISTVGGRYRVYDEKGNRVTIADSKLSDELEDVAFMFYRPFPNEKITPAKLILFGMQKAYLSDIIRIVVLAVIGTLTGLLIPYFNETLFDEYIPLGDAGMVLQIGFVILACAIGNIAFTIVKNLSVFRSMSSMEYALQNAMLDRIFNLPESFLRQYESADLGIRAMNVSNIYSIISQTVITSLLSALFSLIYLVRMVNYSGELTKWAVIMLLISTGIMVIMGLKKIRYEKEKTLVDQKASSAMFQYISGIEKIRISSSEDRALMQYLQKLITSIRINIRKEKITLFAGVLAQAMELLFSVVLYSLMMDSELDLTIGTFMGFFTAFGLLYAAVFEMTQNFFVANAVYPMYKLSQPILETLPESSGDSIVPGDLSGEIDISNVSFAYNADDRPVLNEVNLHFESGEYIGIVGSSGSGKSTLLKLIMGFEKPLLGKIYFDGQDIDDLDKRELRKKFGVVLQDGGLIGGNIYDNITITAPNCSMDRVREVIRQVGLEKDIADMPLGLGTIVNEEGGTLSGGQIQRILIARAIVGKPKIIVLDEATSALDNLTQNQVMETLEQLDATKIVVAHRLSTVEKCDRIIVLEDGKVVEEGTYRELMEKKGRFYELAIRQIA